MNDKEIINTVNNLVKNGAMTVRNDRNGNRNATRWCNQS